MHAHVTCTDTMLLSTPTAPAAAPLDAISGDRDGSIICITSDVSASNAAPATAAALLAPQESDDGVPTVERACRRRAGTKSARPPAGALPAAAQPQHIDLT